jgi:glutathione S-transferase
MKSRIPELKLISHHLCPYVQRARIALAEKGLNYAVEFIDLAAKPDWFLRLSPTGKTPLLLADGEAIFESAVIAEYVDELRAPSLHPRDPLRKARHRAWIEFASAILNGIARYYNATDRIAHEAARAALNAQFARVENELRDGPYFDGTEFSLVDAAFAPVFRYFDVFEQLGEAPFFDDRPKLAAWRRALAARPSVIAAAAPEYPARLSDFLARRGSVLGELARRRRAA